MGFKKVCFKCRKAFNIPDLQAESLNLICPECGLPVKCFNHKFRPPKKSDLKAWGLIKFMADNGFNYQHIQMHIENTPVYYQIKYPKTMVEAKKLMGCIKKNPSKYHSF